MTRMQTYLIEFRFQSKRVKSYLKRRIYDINRKFRVGKKRHVPHITLCGPLKTNNEKGLISDFARVCSETKLMKFKLKGFGTFDNNRVVYINISASEKLEDLRIRLRDALRSFCQLQPQDKRAKEKFAYHSTLAMKLTPEKFKKIKSYVNRKPEPHYSQIVMRVTLLKGGKILREYDFLQRKLLNRRQAKNRAVLRRSKELLRRFMQGSYDPNKRISRRAKHETKSLWRKILDIFRL